MRATNFTMTQFQEAFNKGIEQAYSLGYKEVKDTNSYTLAFNNRAIKINGRTTKKGTHYTIELMTKTFSSRSVKEIENTIAHEILHTIKNGMQHKNEWAEASNRMNYHYGYNISRCGTSEYQTASEISCKYKVKCTCGHIYNLHRKNKFIVSVIENNGQHWTCGKCNNKGGFTLL